MSDLERKDFAEDISNIKIGDISSNNTSVGDIIGDGNTVIVNTPVKDNGNLSNRKFTIGNKIAVISAIAGVIVAITAILALIQNYIDSNEKKLTVIIPSSHYESSVVSQESLMSASELESTSTVTSVPEVSREKEQIAEPAIVDIPKETRKPTPVSTSKPPSQPTKKPTPIPTATVTLPSTESPTITPEPLKEYRYRDLKFTESRSLAEGFGIVKTEDGGYSPYSGWSGWSDDFIEETDLCKVETQTIDTSYTLYWYWRFYEQSTGIYWSYAKSGTIRENHYTFSPLTVTRPAEFGNVTIYYDGEIKLANAWFINTDWPTEIIPSEKIQYRHRTREKIDVYYYWGEWSDWSTAEVFKTAERDVEIR